MPSLLAVSLLHSKAAQFRAHPSTPLGRADLWRPTTAVSLLTPCFESSISSTRSSSRSSFRAPHSSWRSRAPNGVCDLRELAVCVSFERQGVRVVHNQPDRDQAIEGDDQMPGGNAAEALLK